MRNFINFRPGVSFAIGLGAGLILSGATERLIETQACAQEITTAKQTATTGTTGIAETINGKLPDQAHAMADVGQHFANLWFAANKQNWPLARYYLDETRSHLKWAVRIQPVRKTMAGDVDLNGILEAVDNTMLAEVAKAIESKDTAKFEAQYRQTLVGCYACHAACEKPFLHLQVPAAPGAPIIDFSVPVEAVEASAQPGDSSRGKIFFQQNCALCHSVNLGPGNAVITGQGPTLVGIPGRRAASGPNFNYSKALVESQLVWDSATLDRFLANPIGAVPGTTMMVSIPSAGNRRDLVAYLETLAAPADFSPTANPTPVAAAGPDAGDWHNDSPGVKHRVNLAALPAPFSTPSAGNGPQVVKRPADAVLSVPPNFTVRLFADGLKGPRLMRVAPNGDIFIAETGANRIRVLRAADGAEAPSQNEIFADGLNRPFGIAFYPSSGDPEWIYVANNNSVVRFPYRNGDLKARDAAQVIVPKLTKTTGGHTTRDVAFSKDGKRMFIAVGSGSNVAEDMSKKNSDAINLWEAERGRGAAWDGESNRANILVTDPEGREPLRTFATGVRNGAVLTVDQDTGELWVSTNERDGLGDDLVPDYITRLKEGGFYGWPWYYMGNHEDPRHAGERPDLAGQAIVPDVPLQAHSATLEMTFYTATSGAAAFPAEYQGDIFAAFHGSWNRGSRTGYKVVRVRRDHGVPTGEYDDFLTGFVVDGSSVWGRPVGVAVAHDGALLVTEDGNGTLWRIACTH
jgi:glucose/arabinose dehydrogenase/mono/diheme cytochrome c family protein